MLHQLFHIATKELYQHWLAKRLPDELKEANCFHDHIVYTLEDGATVIWSRTKITEQLKKSNKDTVPLLWDLCRNYDCGDETSKALRQYCRNELGIQIEDVPFYRDEHELVTSGEGTKLKDTKEVIVKVEQDCMTIRIQPTEKLQRFLWERLKALTTPG